MSMGGKEIATFVVSSGGTRIVDITSAELVRVGYKWEALTDCVGYLRWGSTVKAVTCDAPRNAAGTNDKPVVLYNTPNGNESRPSAGGVSSAGGPTGLVSM
jgi:zona occludens toxin